MVLENMKPVILEVNSNPNIEVSGPVLGKIIPAMV
jgi:hypothetical protein